MTLIKILCKLSQILQGFYFVNMTTFYVLGQKFVKFFFGFLENLRNQKDILRLTDLYLSDIIVLLGIIFVAFHIISINQ